MVKAGLVLGLFGGSQRYADFQVSSFVPSTALGTLKGIASCRTPFLFEETLIFLWWVTLVLAKVR